MTASHKGVTSQLLRYCAARPDASDTIDGIAWWLAQQRFREARSDIEQVVDELVKCGILDRQVLADGAVLFRCQAGRVTMPKK